MTEPNQPILSEHPKPDSLLEAAEAGALQRQAQLGRVPAEHVLMTTSEVAAYFQVTERTVEAWRAKRGLPYRKIGRTIRFKLCDLLQVLDDRFFVSRKS